MESRPAWALPIAKRRPNIADFVGPCDNGYDAVVGLVCPTYVSAMRRGSVQPDIATTTIEQVFPASRLARRDGDVKLFRLGQPHRASKDPLNVNGNHWLTVTARRSPIPSADY
jgi:hypothetical protein